MDIHLSHCRSLPLHSPPFLFSLDLPLCPADAPSVCVSASFLSASFLAWLTCLWVEALDTAHSAIAQAAFCPISRSKVLLEESLV